MQQLLLGCVSDFDGFADDLRDRLLRCPATSARKRALRDLSFQSITFAADRLNQWYGFDIVDGIAADES